MIKKPRDLLWAIPLALCITSPVWKPYVADFLKPRSDFASNKESVKVTASQHFQMEQVTITLNTEGKQEWLIHSTHAQTGDTDRIILMENVDAQYIGKERQPMHINSKQGQYLIDDRHLTLTDDVVITRPQNKEVMYTDLLQYYDITKMLISPGKVQLRGPDFNLEAGRMDYDLSVDGYDFSERVNVDL
ncbi:MAG: LPS export ABC transporter periplasmic protein LptC [Desulfobulbus propionicus]|nr:MAG: LPS export ABC transporter periplasmic protein LptC [Desulfobulbus propionicus]